MQGLEFIGRQNTGDLGQNLRLNGNSQQFGNGCQHTIQRRTGLWLFGLPGLAVPTLGKIPAGTELT